jgi:hypothetical protein
MASTQTEPVTTIKPHFTYVTELRNEKWGVCELTTGRVLAERCTQAEAWAVSAEIDRGARQ